MTRVPAAVVFPFGTRLTGSPGKLRPENARSQRHEHRRRASERSSPPPQTFAHAGPTLWQAGSAWREHRPRWHFQNRNRRPVRPRLRSQSVCQGSRRVRRLAPGGIEVVSMPAFYRASLAQFLADDSERILGLLVAGIAGLGFAELKQKQTKAWQKQIAALKTSGAALTSNPDIANWSLLLEYPIPRRQKRIDAVLLASDVIFCLEFKTEDKAHSRQAQQQAEDYALDLRDFHEQSRGRRIVPVAVALRAEPVADERSSLADDWVRPVVLAGGGDLAQRLASAFHEESQLGSPAIDAAAWDLSAYRQCQPSSKRQRHCSLATTSGRLPTRTPAQSTSQRPRISSLR